MCTRRILGLLWLTSLAILAQAAEPGDDLQGPWRGGFEDTTYGNVAIEVQLWRQGPSVLTGLIRYGEGPCIKNLIQVTGPRVPEYGDEQPTWFEDRADPPAARCGHFESPSRIMVRRGKDKWIGFAQRTLEWTRLDRRSGDLLSEAQLDQRPNTTEMDQAVRAFLQKRPPVGAPSVPATAATPSTGPSAFSQRVIGTWAGMSTRPSGASAPLELQIWRDGDRLGGFALYPSSRCTWVLTQQMDGSNVAKFSEDSPPPGTPCRPGASITLSTGEGDTLQLSWSGPPSNPATATGTLIRVAVSDMLKAAMAQRGVAGVKPEPIPAEPRRDPNPPGPQRQLSTSVMALQGPPGDPADDRIDGGDAKFWLRKLGNIDREAMGIANLSLFFPEDPGDVQRGFQLAVDVAQREKFDVAPLKDLMAAAARVEQEYGRDPAKNHSIYTLSMRRGALARLMVGAFVNKQPAALAQYRKLVEYFQSTPFLRRAVQMSTRQAELIVALDDVGAILNKRPQDDLSSRLALVTTEQIEFIVRGTTIARAQMAVTHYDGVRRAVLGQYFGNKVLSNTINEALSAKICLATHVQLDSSVCSTGSGVSCERLVINCP